MSEDASLKERLKKAFGLAHRRPSKPGPTRDLVITSDLLGSVTSDNSFPQRTLAVNQLTNGIRGRLLEETAVEALWFAVGDLLTSQYPCATRHAVWRLLLVLLESQQGPGNHDRLGPMRHRFFQEVWNRRCKEDLALRLAVFIALSDGGKDLEYFEEECGGLLLAFLAECTDSTSVVSCEQISSSGSAVVEKNCSFVVAENSEQLREQYFGLLFTVIEFNSGHLDLDTLADVIKLTLSLSRRFAARDGSFYLRLFDSIVTYSTVQAHALNALVQNLCTLLSLAQLRREAWKVVRKLLCSANGHPTLNVFLALTQQSNTDVCQVRGAIYALGRALWGGDKDRITTLRFSLRTAVSVILAACRNSPDDRDLATEVAMSLTALLKHSPLDVLGSCWNCVMELIDKLVIRFQNSTCNSCSSSTDVELSELLSALEEIVDSKVLAMHQLERALGILQSCSSIRPEQSVVRLVEQLGRQNKRCMIEDDCSWLTRLLDRFFRHEQRTAVRLKALEVLGSVCNCDVASIQTEELLLLLGNVAEDADVKVRRSCADLMLCLAESAPEETALHLLQLPAKLLLRPFRRALATVQSETLLEEVSCGSESQENSLMKAAPMPDFDLQMPLAAVREEDDDDKENVEVDSLEDVQSCAYGLCKLLSSRLPTALGGCWPAQVLRLLIDLLEREYTQPSMFATVPAKSSSAQQIQQDTLANIYYKIFSVLLELRVDSLHRIGLSCVDATAAAPCRYNPFLFSAETDFAQLPHMPDSASAINLCPILHIVLRCLRRERHWTVLQVVLLKLPALLENRLFVTLLSNWIADLVGVLHNLLFDQNLLLPQTLQGGHPPSTVHFHAQVLNVVAPLVAHADLLPGRDIQQSLLDMLLFGIHGHGPASKTCLGALTLALQAMPKIMKQEMGQIGLRLSQISANASLAGPMLEFLSNLVQFPHLYSAFTDNHYLQMFAIVLPYTNPFRFGQYVIALAHDLVIAWFLHCPRCYRLPFVEFILLSLNNHIVRSVQEKETVGADRRAAGAGAANVLEQKKAVVNPTFLMADSPLTSPESRRRVQSANASTMKSISSLPRLAATVVPISDSCSCTSNEEDFVPNRRTSTALFGRHANGAGQLAGLDLVQGPSFANPTATLNAPTRLHKLLAEVCADILVRYAFMPSSGSVSGTASDCVPRRTGLAQMLFRHGRTGTWLLGNRLISITTCRSLLCDKCRLKCGLPTLSSTTAAASTATHHKQEASPMRHSMSTQDSMSIDLRRRHHSAAPDLARSSSAEGGLYLKLDSDKASSSSGRGGTEETRPNDVCACWLRGWTEVVVRRPSGITSWLLHSQMGEQESSLPLEDMGLLSHGQVDLCNSTELRDPGGSLRRSRSSSQLPPQLSSPDSDRSSVAQQDEYNVEGLHRGRGATVSGISYDRSFKERASEMAGPSPSAVFLNLFYSGCFRLEDEMSSHVVDNETSCSEGEQLPLRLWDTPWLELALDRLDRLPAGALHRIGVLYVGPGQSNDQEAILANQAGCERYDSLIQSLGQLVDLHRQPVLLGGLNSRLDGRWAVLWSECFTTVVFHVATLMPEPTRPDHRHQKKKHIGNDYVSIVYNNSGCSYNANTISGQFQLASVIITPLDCAFNLVQVRCKASELEHTLGFLAPKLVPDIHLAKVVRQMAVLADRAAIIMNRGIRDQDNPFGSNALDRLYSIRRIRKKALEERRKAEDVHVSQNKENKPPNYINFVKFIDS